MPGMNSLKEKYQKEGIISKSGYLNVPTHTSYLIPDGSYLKHF